MDGSSLSLHEPGGDVSRRGGDNTAIDADKGPRESLERDGLCTGEGTCATAPLRGVRVVLW
jgi:hypothetical protein